MSKKRCDSNWQTTRATENIEYLPLEVLLVARLTMLTHSGGARVLRLVRQVGVLVLAALDEGRRLRVVRRLVFNCWLGEQALVVF